MQLKLILFLIVAIVQLTFSNPVPPQPNVLSPALQFKQSQLPPGQMLISSRSSIRSPIKTQQQVLRKATPVVTAVISRHTQEVLDVPVDDIQSTLPQIIIVEPHMQPVTIEFRSQSSPVKVNNVHLPGEKGQVQSTRTEEEPDRIIHEVFKPVIQEIREIIQPYRKITQQILPVQEEVHSIVSKGEKRSEIEQVSNQDDSVLASTISDSSITQQDLAALQAQQRIREHTSAPPFSTPGQYQNSTSTLVNEQPANTVVQAGLLGGTRILPSTENIYEQQREVSGNIQGTAVLKKKRSANIFRFDIP